MVSIKLRFFCFGQHIVSLHVHLRVNHSPDRKAERVWLKLNKYCNRFTKLKIEGIELNWNFQHYMTTLLKNVTQLILYGVHIDGHVLTNVLRQCGNINILKFHCTSFNSILEFIHVYEREYPSVQHFSCHIDDDTESAINVRHFIQKN